MSDYADVVAETTATDGTPFRVVLERDGDTESVRGWYSNAGVMYVIDQPRYDVPQEGDIYGLADLIERHDFRVVARWLRLVHGATVVLPLYSNYGRDFNVAAGAATDTPETGDYIGVTFDTPKTRRDTVGERITPTPEGIAEDRATMARALAADVAVYAEWADGEAYFHVVQSAQIDDGDGEISGWDQVDNLGAVVGGFIGREWAEEAAREALADVIADHDETVAQRRADAADDQAEIDELRAIEVGAYAV